jgi:type 1 fimbria pilin
MHVRAIIYLLWLITELGLCIRPGWTAIADPNDVKVTFTGTVFIEPCTIDHGSEMTLHLPAARLSSLQTPGSVSAARSFTLGFSNCPKGMKKIVMSITGTRRADDSKVFGNILKGSDAARGVGIRVWSGNDPTDENARWFHGAARTYDIDQNRAVQINLNADMVSPGGNATHGDVQAEISVTLSYK